MTRTNYLIELSTLALRNQKAEEKSHLLEGALSRYATSLDNLEDYLKYECEFDKTSAEIHELIDKRHDRVVSTLRYYNEQKDIDKFHKSFQALMDDLYFFSSWNHRQLLRLIAVKETEGIS